MAGLLESLRRAIRASRETPSAIAERAGVHRSVVSKLLSGLTVTVEVSERLADALGLAVGLEPKRRRKG